MRSARAALVAASVLLAAMLAGFTVELLRGQAGARDEADRRSSDKAQVAAGLTESLLEVTGTQGADRSRERYGADVHRRMLDRAARSGRSPYIVVVDERGVALAASSATPPATLRRIAAGTPAIDRVLDGETFWLTDVTSTGTGATVEWLILAALAIAGVLAVLLLRRSLHTADALHGTHERLEALNAELERSNAELKRSNGELEHFASVASHDLQEPLRKVQTFGDRLERRFGDDLPDEARDYLRRMRGAADRLSTLIEDLLCLSRVTTHARPPTAVDLTAVAQDVRADLFALRAETRGDVRIGPLPTVEAEPLQMRQLLQNLIANGLKFHRPGIAPVVDVRAVDAEPGRVAFEVADNGIGIAPQYLERIFRVFERLHPRDVYDGTGIGLALCRCIAERHGGTVVAEAEEGAGSRFVVTLPAAAAAAAPDAGAPAAAPAEPVHA